MKTTLFLGRIPSCLILLLFLFPAGAAAVPREVMIFPNSARVTDVIRISLQATGQGSLKALATLPAQVVPESLTIRLDPNVLLRIEDQSWRQINRQEEGKIAELQKKLQNAKMEKIGMLAAFQSLEAQLQFWQAQAKTKARMSDETVGLAALIGKNVKKDMQEKLTLEPEMQRLDKKIQDLQDEINRIAGQKETLWEVTLILSGPPMRETNLTMTYTLKGCGWLSHYRLDARPRDGVIRFAWEAEIWQSSGIDWNQVETELATLQPLSAIAPPDLPPWIIRPRPGVLMNQGRQKAELRAAPAAGAVLSAEAQDEAAPRRETRQATYAVWSLGKRTIPAGSRRRLNIREEVWPADFVHLLRPSQTSQSFIRAAVNLPEGREIPAGTASFLMDGAVVGNRQFTFAGQEGSFFFGTDPLVTVRSILISRKSGEKGLITDRQTQEWGWRLDILNAGSSSVRIRLEEPLPQPRDERIKMTFEWVPEPQEKSSSELTWLMEIPAGGKQSLFTTVRLEAPKEMDLDLGWRR